MMQELNAEEGKTGTNFNQKKNLDCSSHIEKCKASK